MLAAMSIGSDIAASVRAPGMARSAMSGADNREVKAEREVTWGCESLGGLECREPLAEQQPYKPEGCSVRSRGKEAAGKALA